MKTLSSTLNSRRRQKGLAAVEMTIVVPIFLFLLLATAELGRAFYQYSQLEKSTRDSVRLLLNKAFANTTGNANISADLQQQARNLAVYGNIGGTGNALLPSLTTGDVSITVPDTQHVRVTINYDFIPAVFNRIPGFGLGDGYDLVFTMTSSSSMRMTYE